MKKSIPAFLTIFLSSLVSAGPVEGVEQLLRGFGEIIMLIIRFLSDLIFDLESFDEFFIAKFILFIIIFIVTYTVLKKSSMFGDGRSAKNVNMIISISISILAVRFMPDSEFVNGILLPYGAFGAAITTFLPLMIYGLFVTQNVAGSIYRRSAWMLYGAFFVGLWWMRRNEISESIMWIYLIALAFILISVIFDKQIQKMRGLREINRFLTGANSRRIVTLQSRYLVIENNNSVQAIAEKKRIEKELNNLGAYVVS